MSVTPPRPVAACGVPEQQLLIAIEGNIGIGKSTLLAGLRKIYASDPNVAFVDEPVDLWEHSGLLEAMYTGAIDRCSFQQMAVVTRFAALQRAMDSGAKLIITERCVHPPACVCLRACNFRAPRIDAPCDVPRSSIFTDRECFAKVGITSPADVAAYKVTHESLCRALPGQAQLATVLLDAPVNVITDRIRLRGRSAEQGEEAEGKTGGVPVEYLLLLQEAHTAYFSSLGDKEKLCVDATRSPEEVLASVHEAISIFKNRAYPSPGSVLDDLVDSVLGPAERMEAVAY